MTKSELEERVKFLEENNKMLRMLVNGLNERNSQLEKRWNDLKEEIESLAKKKGKKK